MKHIVKIIGIPFFLLAFALSIFGTAPVLADGPSLPGQAFGAGLKHGCALRPEDGSIACWGDNNAGQRDVSLPNHSFVQVSAGSNHTCGLRSNGSVSCWGENTYNKATVPSENDSFVQVSAGGSHTCGLKSYGSVVCWGSDASGQSYAPSPNESFTQISAGNNHTCGLKADGSLVCWGANGSGQTNVPSPNGSFSHVSAGSDYTCALKSDGSLACWGGDIGGRTLVPTQNSDFTQVSTGGYHTCALKTDGSLACWGWNGSGETNVPAPNSNFVQVAVGSEFTCGLKSTGAIACWGLGDQGQTAVPAYTFGMDAAAPSVVSSLRADASPTGATSVAFTVTFSEFVVGVSVDDFDLTTSGLTGASITEVSGSGSVYTVTALTGVSDGSGTLRLDVLAADSIRDAVNLPLAGGYATGESYAIMDNVGPTVVSITRLTPAGSPTNADALIFRVAFSEAVDSIDGADFTVEGATTATVADVSAFDALHYDVTVSGGDLAGFNGEVGLSLSATQDIQDGMGNPLTGGEPETDEIYVLDNVLPEVSVPGNIAEEAVGPVGNGIGFTVSATDSLDGDLAASCDHESGATFPLGVTTVSCSATDRAGNVGSDSFTITVHDTTAPVVTAPENITEEASGPSGAAVTFSVSAHDLVDGDLIATCDHESGATFPLGETTVSCTATDAASNVGSDAFTITVVDTTSPSVVSITRAGENPTGAAYVDFVVTFSEAVLGVDLSDFALAGTALVDPALSSISGSGSVYTVTVYTGLGNGTLRLDVVADGSIHDAADHVLSAGYSSGETYQLDGRVVFIPLVWKH